MIDALSDNELWGVLQSRIRGRIPGFKIAFKDENWGQKIIGKFAFFNRKYMTGYTTTVGQTVFFPSKKFIDGNPIKAFKILAHEYVHLLDGKEHPIFFKLLYSWPQFLFIFSLLAILSIWMGNWWLLSLTSLLALLPWPSKGRAVLEMRGYAMNLAIDIWRHGSLTSEARSWVVNHFFSWDYYKMWPFRKTVHNWITEYEQLIFAIDAIGNEESIFDYSVAYQDVYEILTGIEY